MRRAVFVAFVVALVVAALACGPSDVAGGPCYEHADAVDANACVKRVVVDTPVACGYQLTSGAHDEFPTCGNASCSWIDIGTGCARLCAMVTLIEPATQCTWDGSSVITCTFC